MCAGSGGLIECSTSASVSQEKISTVSKGASRLRQLDICDGMDVRSSCLSLHQADLTHSLAEPAIKKVRTCKQPGRYS